MILESQDKASLRRLLSSHIPREERVRQVIEEAGLKPHTMTLPGGDVSTQWHNTLNHAEAHGAEALARLLTVAGSTAPGVWEHEATLLERYGAQRPADRPHLASKSNTRARTVILYLAANPLTTDRLDLEKEISLIEQSLRESRDRDLFDFVPALAVQPRNLSELIRRHKPTDGGKLILHFSGHGEADGLIMRGEAGEARKVPAAAFGKLLRRWKDDISLVVLNACGTRGHGEAAVQHIPHAVATTAPIKDRAAQIFAQVFYRALASGEPVDLAYDDGATAVELEGWGPHVLCLLPAEEP